MARLSIRAPQSTTASVLCLPSHLPISIHLGQLDLTVTIDRPRPACGLNMARLMRRQLMLSERGPPRPPPWLLAATVSASCNECFKASVDHRPN